MSENLLKLLKEELAKSEKARSRLITSFEKCKKIGDKPSYNEDELESFEILTARFSRLSNILIKKIFRLI